MKSITPCIFTAILLSFIVVACQPGAPSQENEVEPEPTVEEPADAEKNAEPEPEPTAAPADPLYQGTDGYPWWNDAVFYEVFVRSFYDSDGDGVGDINGLIERLDYINDGDPTTTDDLGATGIWLMPIAVSPSYHGYDVVDYFEVDPEYGTNEDFKRLIDEAHARGIRVIVDLVMNHTSIEHPWFIESQDPESERRDWYVWADEDPGYRGPDGRVAWHSGQNGYYYGVFWSGMPDLNFKNPEVTGEIYAAAEFWLAEMGADGFRLDAIKHLIEEEKVQENTFTTHAWLEDFYDFYKQVDPNALTVGEAWTGTQQVLDYTGDEVDIAFQFDLALANISSAKSGVGESFANALEEIDEIFPPNQYATFITNHDQNRVMSQMRGDVDKARVAASILLTGPGVPFVYYGEEIGMTGIKPDEDIRRPMQWTSEDDRVGFTTGTPWRPPAEDFADVSVALQEEDSDSLLNHYRSLIHLRNNHEALRIGEWTRVEPNSSRLYAFLRHSDDETILVIINANRNPVSADDYRLELVGGPLEGNIKAVSLFGMEPAAPPMVSADGGFNAYIPFEEIPPHSTHIMQLVGE